MKSKSHISIFNTTVEPISSGSRIFNDEEIININEFFEAIADPSEFVVISNNVSKWSDATEVQNFILTDILYPESGYDITATFTHYGRSLSSVTNRKLIISIKSGKNAKLKASYFSS